jgi:hypothetical protein
MEGEREEEGEGESREGRGGMYVCVGRGIFSRGGTREEGRRGRRGGEFSAGGELKH